MRRPRDAGRAGALRIRDVRPRGDRRSAETGAAADRAAAADRRRHAPGRRPSRNRATGALAPEPRAGRAGRRRRPGLAAHPERLTADLDDRDPDYIRENLPLVWLLSSLWFRGEVRNLGNVPEDGPVLLVGNHSGGNMTPDTLVFTLAFYTYFGVERRFHQLAHNLVLASPVGQILRRYGTVAASHEQRPQGAEAGAAVLVYPGGDWEVHRPELGVATRSTSPAARASSGWRSRPACRSSPSSRSAARRRRCS